MEAQDPRARSGGHEGAVEPFRRGLADDRGARSPFPPARLESQQRVERMSDPGTARDRAKAKLTLPFECAPASSDLRPQVSAHRREQVCLRRPAEPCGGSARATFAESIAGGPQRTARHVGRRRVTDEPLEAKCGRPGLQHAAPHAGASVVVASRRRPSRRCGRSRRPPVLAHPSQGGAGDHVAVRPAQHLDDGFGVEGGVPGVEPRDGEEGAGRERVPGVRRGRAVRRGRCASGVPAASSRGESRSAGQRASCTTRRTILAFRLRETDSFRPTQPVPHTPG